MLLLTALGAWSWITVISSESTERTMAEVARIATYLGFFLLALFTLDRRRVPALVLGVGSAIGLIATLAVLSRLQPQLFPANETGDFLPIAQSRLNWPLNYWNGLAALCAIGLPLALALRRLASLRARPRPRRRPRPGAGALHRSDDLAWRHRRRGTGRHRADRARAAADPAARDTGDHRRGERDPDRRRCTARPRPQGPRGQRSRSLRATSSPSYWPSWPPARMLLQIGVALLESLREPAAARFSPRQVGIATAAVAVVAVVIAVAAGAPGQLADAWDEFKSPAAQQQLTGNYDPSRLGSLSSNGRYELWGVALDSLSAHPASGTGPGTFEFTWLRDTSIGGTVQDAHSLYLELGAEAGWPGLILGAAFVLLLLSGALVLLRLDRATRWLAAGALAAVTAFAFSAGVDWMWELPVLPFAALLLAAAAFACRRGGADPASRPDGRRRAAFAVAALVPIGLLVVVLAEASSVEQSRASARAGALPAALERAVDAHAIDPGAATPLLQAALVRETAGNDAGAAADAREATRLEPDNWRAGTYCRDWRPRPAQRSVGRGVQEGPRTESQAPGVPMTLRPDDLEPGVPDSERSALERTVSRLSAERPVPAAAFRGDLRRRLLAGAGGRAAHDSGSLGRAGWLTVRWPWGPRCCLSPGPASPTRGRWRRPTSRTPSRPR